MSERDGYEPGVPCWVDTLQPDPDAAIAFYAGVFGWEVGAPGEMPGDPPGRYFVAQLHGRDVAGIGSQPADGQPLPPSFNMYVWVDSADDAAAEAQAAGGTILVEPFDTPPAGRMAVIADPTGAPVCVWQPGIRQGAQRVNEAGAWAMSQLHTPDPERAAAFYGAVFGWTVGDFGGMGVWNLGEKGIGGIMDMPPGTPDEVPAYWITIFSVADADESAENAASRGGEVVSPPTDLPGVGRFALLTDPQGVYFGIIASATG